MLHKLTLEELDTNIAGRMTCKTLSKPLKRGHVPHHQKRLISNMFLS